MRGVTSTGRSGTSKHGEKPKKKSTRLMFDRVEVLQSSMVETMEQYVVMQQASGM